MAEDLLTPSNTLVKVRWQEPYVSEGLNKKLNGLVPHGVIRGGRLGTSALDSTVVVEADDDTGDSIYSVVDANGHQLTFRQVGNVNLDLDVGTLPGTTAYIGLDVTYSTTAATVVKWRGYSAAEIDADPTIVCLGSADVPAVAAVIPAGDIYGDRRTDGGLDISGGMRPWEQIIKNPSFEGHEVICNAAAGIVEFPHWQFNCQFSAGQIHTLTPDSTPAANPRSGVGTLGVEGGGAGSHNFLIYPDVKPRVFAGQMVRFSVWVRGTSVTFGSGASGYARIGITGYEYDGGGPPLFTNAQLDGTVLTGTFDYVELSGTFVIPADTAYVQLQLSVVDGTSLSGTLEFDDFRFWIEQGPVDNPLYQDMAVVGSEQNTEALVVSPNTAQTVLNPATVRERSIRLGCESSGASTLEYAWKPAKDAVTSFLMNLPKGRLSLGEDLASSAAETIIPRLSTDFTDYATGRYTLLWEMPNGRLAANQGNIRVYATNQTDNITHYFGGRTDIALVVTVNAEWNGSQWVFDETGDAARWDWALSGVFYYVRESSASSPWDDDEWEDFAGAADSYAYFAVRPFSVGRAHILLPDGRLRFLATNTDAQGSNPPYTTSPDENTLYAKSMCKAWSYFEVDSAGNLATIDGFNMTPGTPTATGIPFTIGTNMAVATYSIVTTVECPPTQQALLSLQPHTLALGSFDTTLLATTITSPSNTSIFDVVNLTTTARFFVQIFGRN